MTRTRALPAWSMLATAAGAAREPRDLPAAGDGWIPAAVPGTVAQSLALAGRLDEQFRVEGVEGNKAQTARDPATLRLVRLYSPTDPGADLVDAHGFGQN